MPILHTANTNPPAGKTWRRLRWGAAFVAASLSGCHGLQEWVHNGFKVGPNYHRPAAPVAEKWIDAADVRVRSESFDDSHWWTLLHDPCLDKLVQEAYAQNLTVREAGFRVLQSRAALGISIGRFFPQAQDMFGSYQRHMISRNRASSFGGLGERYFNDWQVGFNLAWEIDFWGRFRRAIEAHAAELDASVENYDDVLVTLIGDVAEAYTNIRVLQARIALAHQRVEQQKGELRIAEDRFKDGATSDLDVEQAKNILAQTEALIPPFEIELRLNANRLCVLLGVPPCDLMAKLGGAPIPNVPVDVVVGIPAELLCRRPDVRRAEREAAAQSARIGVATSDLYPQVSVLGRIGLEAQHFEDLFEGKSGFGNVGPSFTWNILNYGRIVNNIKLQDARFQELATKYQNTVLQANAEVENGLVRFLQSQREVKFLTEAEAAAKKSVELANIQYKEGKTDFNRVYVTENVLVNAQQQLATARGNVVLGLIAVYRALGGGWQIRCQEDGPLLASPEPPVAPKPVEMLPAPKQDAKDDKDKKDRAALEPLPEPTPE